MYLRVRLAKHPDFRVEENGDVHHDLALSAPEAVLGHRAERPYLGRRAGQVKDPRRQPAWSAFPTAGQGMPGPGGTRGDLYVSLDVALPRELTEEDRALWEKLRG